PPAKNRHARQKKLMRRMATDAPDRLSVLLDCWLMVTEIARSALERITGTNLLIPGPLASFFLPYMLPYKKKKMLVLWAFRERRPITGITICCLRACRERPCHRRAAAERGDELATFQLIELHSDPTSQGRTTGYRTGGE